MKKILFILKGALEKAVPIISIAQAFNSKGYKVRIICASSDKGVYDELATLGIDVNALNISAGGGFVSKLRSWILFRNKVKIYLKKEKTDFLYISTIHTAIALRGLFEKKYKYFLHLRELYDAFPHYMKLVKKPARLAYKVIVPEENRAYLYYNFLKLNKVPTVIPNRPFFHPRKKQMDISFLEQEIQQKIKNKKNIIYQGPLHQERNLSVLLQLLRNKDQYNIILMGKDYGMLQKYKKINPNIIYIPFVRPPLHLNITSWAYIGVITYDFKSLNTIYCAPNKIWEFAGFGIPILANINLGLQYIVSSNRTGVSIDYSVKKEIEQGILELNKNHDFYSNNSHNFYDSIDINLILNKLI